MLSPCKDCEKRELGCHSRCEAYRLYDKENQERRKKRIAISTIDDLRANNIQKLKKRKRLY